MKVYVISCSYAYYDDSRDRILDVYLDKNKADELVANLTPLSFELYNTFHRSWLVPNKKEALSQIPALKDKIFALDKGFDMDDCIIWEYYVSEHEVIE